MVKTAKSRVYSLYTSSLPTNDRIASVHTGVHYNLASLSDSRHPREKLEKNVIVLDHPMNSMFPTHILIEEASPDGLKIKPHGLILLLSFLLGGASS